jgi:hypothetical protein
MTLYGLGSGFWVLLIAPSLASLPGVAASCLELLRRGIVRPSALMLVIAFLLLAIAVLATVAGAAAGRTSRNGVLPPHAPAPVIDAGTIWLPIIASFIGEALLLAVIMGLHGGRYALDPATTFVGPLHLTVIAVLIALFAVLRGRSLPDVAPAGPSLPDRIVAPALIFVCAGAEGLTWWLGLPTPLDGPWLIVVVAVALNLRAEIHALRSGEQPAAPEGRPLLGGGGRIG